MTPNPDFATSGFEFHLGTNRVLPFDLPFFSSPQLDSSSPENEDGQRPRVGRRSFIPFVSQWPSTYYRAWPLCIFVSKTPLTAGSANWRASISRGRSRGLAKAIVDDKTRLTVLRIVPALASRSQSDCCCPIVRDCQTMAGWQYCRS